MLHFRPHQLFALFFIAIAFCVGASGFTREYGLDSYEIFLNQQLVAKHYINQPEKERTIPLATANRGDQLRVKYVHCNSKSAGTGRSISLLDQKGELVRTWSFADAKGSYAGMAIPVSDVFDAKKSHPGQDFKLLYKAKQLPDGQTLSTLNF